MIVTIRMYNVGFGDCFLVTIADADQVWRMLVDCGVHSQGQARPIAESVRAVIADLVAESPDGVPRLDVVAATHHHADHIAGFALDDWEQVEVREVWLPFVEDESDADAVALRKRQSLTARLLLDRIERHPALAATRGTAATRAAREFALNSLRNADAADRLHGRDGRRFATTPTVRFLPNRSAANAIALPMPGATVHVLGPSRDPARLRQMDPPAGVAWLRLDADADVADPDDREPLFGPEFVVADPRRLPPDLLRARSGLRLTLDRELLAASSILERAVNNTSLFLVLDVRGTRFIFPGDAQYGAWEHVLDDPVGRALLTDAAFYKVGHHGSHNATPKRFLNEVWGKGGYAMLPYGLVRRWERTIPKAEIIEALRLQEHPLVRADDLQQVTPQVRLHDQLWAEIRFDIAEPEPAVPGDVAVPAALDCDG